MEERIKQICDATMEHIHYVLNQADKGAVIRFGRKTLRDSMPFELGIIEHNKAIDYLLEQGFIKQLGRHTVGLGTGEGIKKYKPMAGSSTEVTSKTVSEKTEPQQKTPEQSNDNRAEAVKEPAVTNPPSKTMPTSSENASDVSIDHHQLEQELLDIHRALNASPTFNNAEQKIKTLERLRLIFVHKSPGTAQVLETIINDYAELHQGKAA